MAWLSDASSIEVLLDMDKEFGVEFSTGRKLSADMNIWLLEFDTQKYSTDEVLQALHLHPEVIMAQSNHRLQKRETTPSDPDFTQQWALNNDGGGTAVEGADIHITDAWDITTGGPTVHGDEIVIAVIDDGFDLNHEDLTFWKNTDETPGDGDDADNNGYIDDYDGWDAHDDDGTLPSAFHGTHVSGIAAAKGDNGMGISGVIWDAEVMPIHCDVEEDEVVAAYGYVYSQRKLYNETNGQKGAFVVVTNSSFGVDFADPEDYPIWCAMYDSLGALGILNATATINSYVNVDVQGDVPTGCASDHVIAVTNTDNRDELTFSGYGPETIDLGAPGEGIFSTTPSDGYGFSTGTSMSSPHVAGAVALMFAAACEKFMNDYKFSPGTMSLLLKDYLLESVDFIPDLVNLSVSEGRLNVYQALLALQNNYCSPTGLENILETSIKIYPNPTSNLVTIDGMNEKTIIYLTSLSGQQLGAYETQGSSLQIGTGDLPSGMYFLELVNDKGIVSTRLIVE